MIEVRRGGERFCTRTGWLTSWHSFSYGQWYDADNVGFGPLVVSNHDVLGPGAGFEDHRHAGVDLVTYVVSGMLEHRDSAGHVGVLGGGELQVLHAGDGIVHSERNASSVEPVEYVQMWLASGGDTAASYERVSSPVVLPAGVLSVVDLASGVAWSLGSDMGHVYVVQGEVSAAGERVLAGDALRVQGSDLDVDSRAPSRLLAWTLPNT